MQTRESTCELVHFVRHTVYARLTTLALSIVIKATQDRGYLMQSLGHILVDGDNQVTNFVGFQRSLCPLLHHPKF